RRRPPQLVGIVGKFSADIDGVERPPFRCGEDLRVDDVGQADKAGQALATTVRTDSFHAITEITVLSPDHPRLLAVIAGACAAA
ncbi:hypothetical protein ACC759_38050, partial [Rhizobium ruizarguesonis]